MPGTCPKRSAHKKTQSKVDPDPFSPSSSSTSLSPTRPPSPWIPPSQSLTPNMRHSTGASRRGVTHLRLLRDTSSSCVILSHRAWCSSCSGCAASSCSFCSSSSSSSTLSIDGYLAFGITLSSTQFPSRFGNTFAIAAATAGDAAAPITTSPGRIKPSIARGQTTGSGTADCDLQTVTIDRKGGPERRLGTCAVVVRGGGHGCAWG